MVEQLREQLIGLPVAHIWQGAGTTIFIELGSLSPTIKRNGAAGNPQGQVALHIDGCWRIESENSIICGAWSSPENWPSSFESLLSATVVGVALVGSLLEIEVHLSNGKRIATFAAEAGQPQWSVYNPSENLMLYSENGAIKQGPYGS